MSEPIVGTCTFACPCGAPVPNLPALFRHVAACTAAGPASRRLAGRLEVKLAPAAPAVLEPLPELEPLPLYCACGMRVRGEASWLHHARACSRLSPEKRAMADRQLTERYAGQWTAIPVS